MAAALRKVLSTEPIVVGGLAEDYYTADQYQPTDLDLCAPVTQADARAMRGLGFKKEGRHWYHEDSLVAVEFPSARIDGDESRTIEVDLGQGSARVIGIDDLYLDRLRQATMTELSSDISFMGAVAIAAARFEDLDWKYIRQRIGGIQKAEPQTGSSMSTLNSRVRRRVKRAITPAE